MSEKSRTVEWAALCLLALYSFDFAWKLAYWRRFTDHLPIWTILGALAIRVTMMTALVIIYLRARKSNGNLC